MSMTAIHIVMRSFLCFVIEFVKRLDEMEHLAIAIERLVFRQFGRWESPFVS